VYLESINFEYVAYTMGMCMCSRLYIPRGGLDRKHTEAYWGNWWMKNWTRANNLLSQRRRPIMFWAASEV